MAGDLRIIGGSARGRRLASAPGQEVRPTSSRVREAIFSILMDRVPGAQVLDLFAGVGTLGLEALSRGAAAVLFLEQNPRHAAAINSSLETLGFDDRGRVMRMDVVRFLARGRAARPAGGFDVVFVDPPYAAGQLETTLPLLATADIIAPGGVAVVEHGAELAAKTTAGWEKGRTYRYGKTSVTLLFPDSPDQGDTP
ncbi:MAG: 16S rRNA (guanine(966)-N(2))-methyltransferase RsmD [Nitrospirota bacterium]|nr:16S rRNA (guanine(966)-N(2))-methyltransferase RsmD [Nitrospirota bacterium]